MDSGSLSIKGWEITWIHISCEYEYVRTIIDLQPNSRNHEVLTRKVFEHLSLAEVLPSEQF